MTGMKRLAAALIAVLALSACAVTGQPAHPGTAATYDGSTITVDEVAAWGSAQTQMQYSYDPGAVLSLLLLRPALVAETKKQSIVFGDEQIATEATMWMTSHGADAVTPTADMIDLVRTVRMLHALLSTQEGSTAVMLALKSIEADSQVSPMYGTFSATRFVNSVSQQATAQQDAAGALGDVSYLVFKDVNGFDVTAQQGWMVDEGPQPASPSPSAAP